MNLVPLFEQWTGSETKLDIKAVYSRPGDGVNLTGPLPLRRHADWSGRKGFTYVCLATLDDLKEVAGDLRARGLDPLAMRDCFDPRSGQFNVPLYLRERTAADAERLADLQDKVEKYGEEAVTDMMRVADPAFEMPASVRKGRKAAPRPKDAA